MDTSTHDDAPPKARRKTKKDGSGDDAGKKRRCISSACVPCRKRKSKVCACSAAWLCMRSY